MSDSSGDTTSSPEQQSPAKRRKSEPGYERMSPFNVQRETLDSLIENMSRLGPVEFNHGEYTYTSLEALETDAGPVLKSIELRAGTTSARGGSVSVGLRPKYHSIYRYGSSDDTETACWHLVREQLRKASPWYQRALGPDAPGNSAIVSVLVFGFFAMYLGVQYEQGEVPAMALTILKSLGLVVGLCIVWVLSALMYRRTRKVYIVRSHERGNFYRRHQSLVDGAVGAIVGSAVTFLLTRLVD